MQKLLLWMLERFVNLKVISKIIKIFLLSWIFFYQQVFAEQVFFLENRGSVVSDYRETRRRMDALGLGVSNTRVPSGPNRQRLRELRERILQNARSLTHSVWSPTARDIEKINQVRRDFGEFQSLASDEHLQGVFDYASRMLGGDSLMVPDRSLESSAASNQIPNYCENYPVLDRELLQSFYGGAQAGEEFNCYELDGNGVGLDLSDIGAALLSIEEEDYSQEKRELQNGLIVKAVSGILEESSAYAGIYPGTDNNLSRLKQCTRRNGPQELREAVSQHEENLPETISRLNGAFGEAENARRNALMATQVRQALIIGNLYNISQRARTQAGGTQVATVGGSPFDRFSEEVRGQCQEQMVREHGFAFSDNEYDHSENLARCREYVASGRYENLRACAQAYSAFRANIDFQTSQRACYYQRSGRENEAPLNIVADNLIPLMSASVDSHPLLFNRDDNRSLIPFVSSESNYVPSDFANLVKDLPGAAQISRAVEEVLATNPENPREAIELRLARPDMLALMAGAISSAQQSEELNNSLKNEITDYQNELGESARNVCHNDGEHLHQFPSLVNDVISDELEGVSDPQERERLLARRQAAQCWMLEDDPPESEGGLPGGFFALGVGAIALGMIPGIGWAASAALIAAGTGVAATDSYLRFDHARDQLNATTAAFQGGWADTSLVLERAAARTDAQTMLWAEGLTVGILDVASPAGRALVRSLRENDEIAGAITRFANDETGSVPFIGERNSASVPRVAERLANGDEELVVLTTRRVVDSDVPVSVGPRSLDHMRDHDYPGGLSYIENLFGRLREENISVESLREMVSSRNGRPIFDNLLEAAGNQGDDINFNELLAFIREHRTPSGQDLNEGINRILSQVDGVAFRKDRPTSLYPEEARLEDVIESLRRGEGRIIDHERRTNAFYFEINNRRYEASFCNNRNGCGCDENNVCNRAYGELNSMFPSCGEDVFMLSQSPNLVGALLGGALDDPTYLSERRYEAPAIRGAVTGRFPSDGLIRRVDCL